MNEVKKNFSKWMYYFLLALAIIIVYKFLDNFTAIGQAIGKFFDVIAPFLTGGLLTYLLYIPASRIEKGFEKSKRNELLKKNLKAVVIGIVSGVLASMVSVLLLAKLFRLSHEQYVTLLPKSITTAIGMGVSEELGGIVTITVAVIIITGVLGNMIAETVIKLAHIEEPIAKGLALGTSAHAIGTAKAMELGEVEGAMSSLAIAVAGLLTVVGASVFAQFM